MNMKGTRGEGVVQGVGVPWQCWGAGFRGAGAVLGFGITAQRWWSVAIYSTGSSTAHQRAGPAPSMRFRYSIPGHRGKKKYNNLKSV